MKPALPVLLLLALVMPLLIAAAANTGGGVLVSDGRTPVPVPDGSGAFIVPPAGVPLPLLPAARSSSYVPPCASQVPHNGMSVGAPTGDYAIAPESFVAAGIPPLPVGTCSSAQQSGGVSPLVACTNHHVGWDQYSAAHQRGVSGGLTVNGLPFSFTGSGCSGTDVVAWEGAPLSCNGGCPVYEQAGWATWDSASTTAHMFCETGWVDSNGQQRIDTHPLRGDPTTTYSNGQRFLFWSSRDTGGTWRSFGNNQDLGCASLIGPVVSYGGQFETEVTYSMSSQPTIGPYTFDSMQYHCGTIDWCNMYQVAAVYSPTQADLTSNNNGAGSHTHNTVVVGHGQTQTASGTIWTITYP